MSRKTSATKSGDKARTGNQTTTHDVNRTCHADNYGIEIVGLDELTEMVLSGELLLIMEHFGAMIAADNYFNVDTEGI